MISSLVSDFEPAAVLPMRLSSDGLSSLVIVNRGRSSPGIVFPAAVMTFTVNSSGDTSDANPGDGICHDGAGACTLRAAIEEANANVGADTINITRSEGAFTLSPGSALPQITETLTLDGTTQPGFAGSPRVEIRAAGLSPTDPGLQIGTDSCVVRGLVINRFAAEGVKVLGSSNIIEGNFIGPDLTGTAAILGNRYGVSVSGVTASGNTIGGTTIAARNVISGNTEVNVTISSVAPAGNRVRGNFIGTDSSGTAALGGNGVSVSDSPNNLIGGTSEPERNVISGSSSFNVGIAGALATGNTVQGNFISTDVTGTTALGGDGVFIFLTASNNLIGGVVAEARNIISGGGVGIGVQDNADNNVIQGNFIGTNVDGTTALGNVQGIRISAANTIIGGTVAGAGNLISGNCCGGGGGIDLGTGVGTAVQGNFIGTDVTGTIAIGNGFRSQFRKR